MPKSYREHAVTGKLVVLAFLSLALCTFAGCGDSGSGGFAGTGEAVQAVFDESPAEEDSTETFYADGARTKTLNAPTVVPGFPAMVDQQGVFINAVAAVPGAIYASYIQSGSPYLMLARSDNNGTSWTRSIVDFGGINASMTVDGNNVSIGYIDQSWNTVKFARSADRGTTWTITEVDVTLKSDPASRPPDTDPAHPAPPDDFKYTAMARTGNSFFIVYQDRAHGTLRLARSVNGGATWICSVLDGSHDSDGDSPAITINGTNIYVSYVGITGQGSTARDSIYMMVSRDSGTTWTRRTVAATAFASGYYTSVAASGAKVYVSYFNAQDRTLKLAKSGNYGTKWTVATVDSSSNVGRYPSLQVMQGVMFLSYSDWTNNSLKVAKSTNGGSSWTTKTMANNAGMGCPSASTGLGAELYLLYFHYTPQQSVGTGTMLSKVA